MRLAAGHPPTLEVGAHQRDVGGIEVERAHAHLLVLARAPHHIVLGASRVVDACGHEAVPRQQVDGREQGLVGLGVAVVVRGPDDRDLATVRADNLSPRSNARRSVGGALSLMMAEGRSIPNDGALLGLLYGIDTESIAAASYSPRWIPPGHARACGGAHSEP